MSNRLKKIMTIAVFGGIFLLFLLVFSSMMRPQKWFDEKLIQNRDSRYVQITEQPENTIDVFNIGDSLSLAVFSPMEMWREQGYTGFNIGADGLRMAESYYFLKNACEKQKPKVLLMESLYLFRHSMSDDSVMLLSQPIYYHVPFLKYHNIWKALVELPGVMIYHRGYTVNKNEGPYEGSTDYLNLPLEDKEQKLHIPSFNRLWFDRIKQYCDERGIRIILYSAPSARNYNWERINDLKAFAEEEGIAYIDLNEETEALGIDWQKDTNDSGDHMNYYGCCKATRFLGNYLKENADLTDHRGDPAYADWDEELVAYDQLVIDMKDMSFHDIYNIRKDRLEREREEAKEKRKQKQ